MASRREYEMAFILNATLNGGFKGAMSQAQKEFAALGNEIRNLQKVQNDISSYQKYEKAAESTQAKLENLQKQHDLLQKEIAKTNGDTSALERQDLQLQQRIADTTQSLENQRAKLDAVGQRLQQNGVDTSNLTQESARLASEMGDLKKRQDEAANSADQYGDVASMGFMAAGEALAQSQLLENLQKLGESYAECVNLAMGFESSMSNVAALSGASSSELEELSETAKELGATTKFTATEAADAMGYMAMAGWKSEQMIAGMDGVLQLAAAAGEDLAQTSDIVTDNLTAFGMSADETARFADVLAAAATNSNTSVSIMGETFKNSASVAGALGYSIEDVATMVGLMANAGVKGSIAGTALRNVFNGLLSGVTLTSDAFGEYEFTAVKADGSMKSLSETVEELRYYFDQMSQSERVANATTLAGQRGYNGLLAIVNATDEDFNKLTNSINNSAGAAKRMADIKLDNLAGQMTLLESATDAVKVTLGEEFNAELRDVAEFATDAATRINEWIKQNPALVKGVIAGTAALGGLVTAITGVTMAVKAFQALKAAGAFTALASPLGAVVAVVSLAAGAFVAAKEAQKQLRDESWELSTASMQQKKEIEDLTAQYDETVAKYGEASYEAQKLKWQIDDLTAAYEAGKQTQEEYTATINSHIQAFQETRQAYRETAAEIDLQEQSVLNLVNRLDDLVNSSEGAEGHQMEIEEICKRLNKTMPSLGATYDKVAKKTGSYTDEIRDAISAQSEENRQIELYNALLDASDNQTQLGNDQKDLEARIKADTAALEEAQAAYDAINKGSWGGWAHYEFTEEYQELEAAKQRLQEDQELLDQVNAQLEDGVQNMGDLERRFREVAEVNYTSSEDMLAGIQAVTDQITELQEAYDQAYQSALSSLGGQFTLWDDLDTKLADVEQHTVTQMTDSLAKQTEYWQEYNQNLDTLASKADSIQGLDQMIASFADGSADSVSAIASMASSSDADLQLMVDNWLEVQEAQKSAAEQLAQFQADFDEQMDNLTQTLKDTVAEMDLTQDAANRGKEAIEAFIAAAEAKQPAVASAFAQLRRTADSALQGAVVTAPATGYASGTDSATPGAHWVGEDGPELMWMRGGEKIMNAQQSREYAAAVSSQEYQMAAQAASGTHSAVYGQSGVYRAEASPAQMAGGSSGPVSLSPQVVINVNGNADADALEQIQDYLDGEFMDKLSDWYEDMQTEQRRRAYT